MIFFGENDMAAGFPTVVCCESISIKQTNITVVLNLQFAFFAARHSCSDVCRVWFSEKLSIFDQGYFNLILADMITCLISYLHHNSKLKVLDLRFKCSVV